MGCEYVNVRIVLNKVGIGFHERGDEYSGSIEACDFLFN